MFTLDGEYGIAVELTHKTAAPFKERQQKQFVNEAERQDEIERKEKQFGRYISQKEGTMTRQIVELLLITLGLVLIAIVTARRPALNQVLDVFLAGGATVTAFTLLLLGRFWDKHHNSNAGK